MSHTLHREGSKEGLARDFVVLAMPVQGHTEGSGEKLRRFMDISRKYHPVNNGNSKAGNIYMEGMAAFATLFLQARRTWPAFCRN